VASGLDVRSPGDRIDAGYARGSMTDGYAVGDILGSSTHSASLRLRGQLMPTHVTGILCNAESMKQGFPFPLSMPVFPATV